MSPPAMGANRFGTFVPTRAGAVTKQTHCVNNVIRLLNPSSVRLTSALNMSEPTGLSRSGPPGARPSGIGGPGGIGTLGFKGSASAFGFDDGSPTGSSSVSSAVTALTRSATSASVFTVAFSATGSPTPPRTSGTSPLVSFFASSAFVFSFSNSLTPFVMRALTSSSVIGTIFCFPVSASRCTLNARMASFARLRLR